MDVREEAQAAPPATEAQVLAQQIGSGEVVALPVRRAQEADAEAIDDDDDDWSFVDEQAEIIASVSTSSAYEEVLTEPVDEHKQPATRTDEPNTDAPDTDAHTHIQQQDAMVHESGNKAPAESAPITEEQVSFTPPDTSAAVPHDYLRIRLRVGEQTRPAWFKATQIVDDFVAEFFTDAVAEGKKVRLIYMGMLLIRDRCMGEYGIEEDGVIHCVITEAPSTPHHNAGQQNLELKGFSNPVNTLLILTGVGLYGLWTLLYHFPHLFSWKSIVLLSLFSAAHMSAMVSRFSSSFPVSS